MVTMEMTLAMMVRKISGCMKVPDNSLRIVSTLYWNCWNLVLEDSKVNLSDALDDSKVNLIQVQDGRSTLQCFGVQLIIITHDKN